MKNIKKLLICLISTSLCSCAGFFDKDNTPTPSPLVNFKQEVKVQSVWSSSVGYGVGTDYLKLNPAVTDQAVYTANRDGHVNATNRLTGRSLWSTQTNVPISGGVNAQDGLVLIGSREGDVVALRQADGKILWQTKVSSEVLSSPATGQGIVVAKSIDGKLTGLSAVDGHTVWKYEQTEPVLILRGASAPQVSQNRVVVGFANGNLANLTLREGSLHWQEPIATSEGSFAIQRMIDIDADPYVVRNRIYAATYQGRINALDFNTGKTYWTHDISSYTGLTADSERVFVTDAKSHVWAFDSDSGTVDWRQTQLEARNITAPAMIGNYIVVGDEQGYLHWMSKTDGHFVARVRVDHSGILASPIVNNNVLYVLTRDGRLAAYTLG
jgi:outer membrane protein assembly factor BamB